jgi:hypothetical protein
MCRKTLVLVMLRLLMGCHLFFQQQPPVSTTTSASTSTTQQRTTASNPYWWESHVDSSISQGPLIIPLMPFNVSTENDKAIVQILKHITSFLNSNNNNNNNSMTVPYNGRSLILAYHQNRSYLPNLDISFTPLRHDKRGFNGYKIQ